MNKSDLLKFYNIYKILKAKDLAKLFKTYKDNLQEIIVMFKKKPNNPGSPPKWFTTYMEKFEQKIDQKIDQKINIAISNHPILNQILERLTSVETLLCKVIKLNDLKTN